MKRAIKTLATAAAFVAAVLILAPDIHSCHGILIYRFMPIEQARLEFVRVQADLLKQRRALNEVASPAVDRWIRYYGNPIFRPGPAGSWEEISVDCFTVGYFEGKYWLWYVGTPRGLNCQIGLATSPDGINWTRHPENPILKLGPAGSWDSSILICQHVLFDKEELVYKMWYVGGNPGADFGIGYATSPDGVHWTKYAGNPVMVPDQSWEIGTVLEGQTVLKMGGGYKMWYGAIAIGSDISYMGYASSQDGIHWTKHPSNPVISPSGGTPLEWDGYSVDTPDVLYDGRIFHMYYRGWRKKSGISYIGRATSPDGVVWTRDPDNPVFVTAVIPGAWDVFQIYRARVFWAEGGEDRPVAAVDRMWFTGRDYTLKSQVGLAFSPRQDIAAPKPPGRRIPMTVNQDNLNLVVETDSAGGAILQYFTPWLGDISLRIFDAAGRPVRSIVKEVQLPGFYERRWNGLNARGQALKPGLYYAELTAPNSVLTREVVLVK